MSLIPAQKKHASYAGIPNADLTLTDEKFIEILKRINLEYVLDYAEDSKGEQGADWSKVLSLGEQQRLAFGRLLVQKPTMVFLDEATSALDSGNQKRMYEILKDEGITYVSVGHRASLSSFHEVLLHVVGDGSWRFVTEEEYHNSSKFWG